MFLWISSSKISLVSIIHGKTLTSLASVQLHPLTHLLVIFLCETQMRIPTISVHQNSSNLPCFWTNPIGNPENLEEKNALSLIQLTVHDKNVKLTINAYKMSHFSTSPARFLPEARFVKVYLNMSTYMLLREKWSIYLLYNIC